MACSISIIASSGSISTWKAIAYSLEDYTYIWGLPRTCPENVSCFE
jgi:hypothetical protein